MEGGGVKNWEKFWILWIFQLELLSSNRDRELLILSNVNVFVLQYIFWKEIIIIFLLA